MMNAICILPSQEEIVEYLNKHPLLSGKTLIDDYLNEKYVENSQITDKKIIQAVAQAFANTKKTSNEIRSEVRLLIDRLDQEVNLPAELILQIGADLASALRDLAQGIQF